MRFPTVVEKPSRFSTLRQVGIGNMISGFTHPTNKTSLNVHTGRGREVTGRFIPTDDFAAVGVWVRGEDEEAVVDLFLHTVEAAESLLEAVEAAYRHLRRKEQQEMEALRDLAHRAEQDAETPI